MSKTEWGLKRICPHCNTRYYDMKKNPPVCPSCGSVFDPETLMKTRRGKTPEAKKALAATPEETIDDLPIADGADNDDAVIEDADELGDEDVDEVIEVESDDDARDRT
ncbi:MAG: TIGR02300 family protein [Alphaproteobacteria bacterium]|nr:TIGR02300 family protein [Alphaproteobacteria bacterium]